MTEETILKKYMKGIGFYCPQCDFRIITATTDEYGTCVNGHTNPLKDCRHEEPTIVQENF